MSRRRRPRDEARGLSLAEFLLAEADRCDRLAERYRWRHDQEVRETGGSTYATARALARAKRHQAAEAGDAMATPQQEKLHLHRLRFGAS